jgi:hypothetical protein
MKNRANHQHDDNYTTNPIHTAAEHILTARLLQSPDNDSRALPEPTTF